MTAPSHKNVETQGVVLYQPDDVLRQRVSSMQEVAGYIQQVNAVVDESFKDSKTPEALDVVIIIKPEGQARAWLVSSLPTPPERSGLTGKLQAIPPPPVKGGPFAFAVSYNIAGAQRAKGLSPPAPEEWRKAAENASEPLTIPDGLMDQVWKD